MDRGDYVNHRLMSSHFNRRQFLRYTSGLAISQLPWLSSCSTWPANPEFGIQPQDWKDLAKNLSGPLLLPGNRRFDALAAPWNLRYRNVKKPAGIARCRNHQDVQVCLQWAQAHKMPLVARSGGHSYAGYSTTPGLMIELKLMDSVAFDAASGIATVGGGARNLTLYSALPSKHVAVTHGRCSPVGVGGLVLAGGIGFNMRHRGLLIDQLVGTEVVTADGTIHLCKEGKEKDLFWACRGGGGGNFGINTSFTFQTFPVDTVTVFNIRWDSHLDELLPAALDLLPGTTDRLGCKLSVVRKDGDSMNIQLLGQLVGDCCELCRILAPLFNIATPTKKEICKMEYWDAQKNFLGEDGAPEYSHERSRYAFHSMGKAGPRTILDFMRKWPGTKFGTSWKMFLVGGKIASVSDSETAYSHRQATMLTSVELNWKESDSRETVAKNQVWLNRFHEAMTEHTSDQCYQNFIDDSQKDYLHAYYGSNLPRLVGVKRAVDPHNVFHYPQSIPLTLGA